MQCQHILKTPSLAKQINDFVTPDHLVMALHPGFARIPQRGLDNVQGPNVDCEFFTVITPHKIFTLKTEHLGQRITLHTLVQAFKYVTTEYNASEAKHWLPLFTS